MIKKVKRTFMYIAPRPPPLARPLPPRGLRPGARPRPPRLPLPRRGVSGDFTNTSSIFVFSNTTLSSGGSNILSSDVEEFLLRLDSGVMHALGMLSNASVILGSLILELVGSISSGFCSSTKNFVAVSTIGSASGAGIGSCRLAPRPRPRPPLGLTSIAGRSLQFYK